MHVGGLLCDVGCQAAIEAASPPPPADLAELAARLSFSGTEKQSFVRNGQKGKGAKHSGLSADYKRRRLAALDQALQVSASLIDPHESEELIAEWHARRAAKKPATVATNLLSNTIKFMEASPPTSEARAICSSLLCASVPGPMLTRLSNVRALRPKERAAAIANFELGSAGQPVKRKTKRVPRTRQLAITNLVRWVLRSDNVQLLSWGEKKVRIGKRWKTIPCLSRTMELEEMWRKYDADFKGVNKNDRVHRTNFLLIISDITGKQCQSVKAVDYLVSELVHQNRERLERLIRGVIKDPEEKKALIAELREVFTWVKTSYPRQVGQPDLDVECPSLDFRWAVGVPRPPPLCEDCGQKEAEFGLQCERESKGRRWCTMCGEAHPGAEVLPAAPAAPGPIVKHTGVIALFHWFEHRLKPCIPEKHQSLVTDGLQKLKIFMGHALRTKIQQHAIEAERTRQKSPAGRCRAILIADYKMKIDPSQNRESSVEHYGKRGISYHGVCVAYYKADATEPTLLYFDTVVDMDASQNIGATLSVFEELLRRVRVALPAYITELTVQTDNARNYQNPLFFLLLPILARNAGFDLVRILHTETQDGKCIVDAHFQKVNQQIKRFIGKPGGDGEAMKKACTAAQIFTAIVDGGGIPGTSIALIRLDRAKIQHHLDEYEKVKKTAGLLLPGHVLDVHYNSGGMADTVQETSISPVLKVVRTPTNQSLATKLAKHLETHPLKLSLEEVKKLHNLFAQQPRKRKTPEPPQAPAQAEPLPPPALPAAPSPDQAAIFTGEMTGVMALKEMDMQREQRKLADMTADTEPAIAGSGDVVLRSRARERAMQEFLKAVELPSVGIVTPDTISIDHLAPHGEHRPPQLDFEWGRRPEHGGGKGAKYMCDAFTAVIRTLFLQGEGKKGAKMSAHQMQQEIINRHFERYDIPSVIELSSGISTLMQTIKADAKKKKKAEAKDAGASAGAAEAEVEAEAEAEAEAEMEMAPVADFLGDEADAEAEAETPPLKKRRSSRKRGVQVHES